MIYPAIAVFANHKNDATTYHHLRLLRKYNPFPIIPLHFAGENHLPDSTPIQPAVPDQSNWSMCDQLLYSWFRQRPFSAKRYIFLEWDVYCNMPLQEYYRDLWDADAVGEVLVHAEQDPPAESKLHKIKKKIYYSVPAFLQDHAAGFIPANGSLLSHAALEKITSHPIPQLHCEIRIPTLASYHGFELKSLPFPPVRTNHAAEKSIPSGRGLFHPIKSLWLPHL